MKRILLLLALFLTACVPQADPTPAPVSPLSPYSTTTPAPAVPWTSGLVTASAPLPSPTPFVYTVQQGDTLGSIALKFGVSINDLQAANPEISPNSMSVGQVLQIPSDPENPSGEPTPQPAPFRVEQTACHPSADGGMWCFVLARNDSATALENVSAQVTLFDANGNQLASQPALLILNILPPNTSLPMTVFFDAPIPVDVTPQVQVLTAIQLQANDARYLPASAQNILVQVDWNGHSAQVSGQVFLPAESKAAATVWVAATAYDKFGAVVGVRRWEGGAIPTGTSLPFTMTVSSLGGEIDHVEVVVEARP
ncbi:MAG: LysM peptidoglycan-binding domain-containing protein [Chloroflexi bacterium]|nr:LysM peptidoglycan-binding domain-containing protein [Chloroflexota bacterium]